MLQAYDVQRHGREALQAPEVAREAPANPALQQLRPPREAGAEV